MIDQSLAAPPSASQAPGLHIRRHGRGAPVLCLHAIAHDGRDFDDLAARLDRDFEVIAPDWPGQGLSAPDTAPFSVIRYADLLAALIDELGLRRPIIVGNSVGGAAAVHYALRAPHNVRALVLCNAGGLIPMDRSVRDAIGAMQKFFAAGARGAWWWPRAYRFYYEALVLPRAPRGRREAIVADGKAQAQLLSDAWAAFGSADNDLTARAHEIACPTLFAWAKGDRLIPWSRSRAAAGRFRNGRVSLLRGGHAAFLEDPDAFEQAFRAFAGSV